MYRVGFAQPNFRTGPAHLNSYYLPYSLGTLWSYALTQSDISENFTDAFWLFRRDTITDAYVKQLADSADIVLFSTYVWNWNYCTHLAKRIKQYRPDVRIIFGGPQVPHTDPNFRENFPYIDCVVLGEGEIAFVEILRKYLEGDAPPLFYSVPRLRDLDLPSPYLTGIFDELIDAHPDIEWVPTLETDRGCPYQCTFCDWGSMTASKVVKIYLDRIQAELDWIADKQLPFLSLTSANFGIYKDRDNIIADKIVETKNAHGVPSGVSVSYAKNSNADVFGIIKKFSKVGIQNGFTLSLQSTTPAVLEAIKRTNMDINDISAIAQQAAKEQLPVITEIILGLPEETYDTFVASIMKVMQSGLHNGIEIFLLNMIENAPMRDQVMQYDIKTFTAYDMFYETSAEIVETETREGIEIVLSTSTMTTADIKKAYLFSWFIIGLHTSGYTDILAKYCVKQNITDYYSFYINLIDHLKNLPTISKWVESISSAYDNWIDTGFFVVEVNNKLLSSWQIMQSFNVFVQVDRAETELLDAITQYAKINFDIDDAILQDHCSIVQHRIKKIDYYFREPAQLCTATNLWCYVNAFDETLEHTPTTYIVSDRFNQFPTDIDQHIDNIIYGRRRNWTLNLLDKC